MAKVCGIDEAGRGPVIGGLAISGVLIDEEKLDELRRIGVKDSKLLSIKQIENLHPKIKELAEKIELIVIPPKEIDEAVESQTINLNWLEAHKTAEIINKLNPDRVYIDCPSPNIEAYRNYLKNLLKVDAKLIIEHKADFKYAVTAAASIISKKAREDEVAKIQAKFSENIGSGYPSDPYTKKFIKNNWKKYPEIFRKSWETYKELVRNREQKTLLDG